MGPDSQMIENYADKCDNISELIPEENAERINVLINHPEIRPWVSGDFMGILDATDLVKNKHNIFFTDGPGGCGFIKLRPGVYELHSFCLPEGRGSWVKNSFLKVKDWIFKNTDALMILTLCPKNNRMAIGAARICGFKKYSTIEKGWSQNGNLYDMDSYVLYKEVV